jgi:hypothetical protein
VGRADGRGMRHAGGLTTMDSVVLDRIHMKVKYDYLTFDAAIRLRIIPEPIIMSSEDCYHDN